MTTVVFYKKQFILILCYPIFVHIHGNVLRRRRRKRKEEFKMDLDSEREKMDSLLDWDPIRTSRMGRIAFERMQAGMDEEKVLLYIDEAMPSEMRYYLRFVFPDFVHDLACRYRERADTFPNQPENKHMRDAYNNALAFFSVERLPDGTDIFSTKDPMFKPSRHWFWTAEGSVPGDDFRPREDVGLFHASCRDYNGVNRQFYQKDFTSYSEMRTWLYGFLPLFSVKKPGVFIDGRFRHVC